MARRAKLTLDSLKSRKTTAEADLATSSAISLPKGKGDASGARRGMTLRLNPVAHRQLKQLALDEDKSAHDLVIDGLNLIFKKHGLPTIA